MVDVGTMKPSRVSEEKWAATVKQSTQKSLEQSLADLLEIRAGDQYRELNPRAWRIATRPVTEP